ncbi:MAG: DNA polymerase, partial [Candidatus Thiodiazotropha sp.]
MTEEDHIEYANATHCFICEKAFDKDESNKVIDHCHVSGRFRSAACGSCNLNFQINSFIPVFFHGFRNFDSHIICQAIGEYEDNRKGIKCIPQNMERYISFSLGNLRFLDSFQFLSSSLECLTENLKANGGMKNFKYFFSEFSDKKMAELLLRKNVYPYDYMNDESRFLETTLPPKEAFYSSVRGSNVSDEDYNHACNVFESLNVRNLGEYSDLYLKTDVLLLSDIFENFRKVAHDNYKLDPAQFYSSPGFSFSAMLKMTKVQLELLTDIQHLQLWERGSRGGVSYIGDRFAEANNPYLKSFDPSKPTSYIQFLDANNLYGWACQQPLPIGEFRLFNEQEIKTFDVMTISDDADKGYLVEVSLRYPAYLHSDHNCFPLAPVKRLIKNEELSPYALNAWTKLRGKTKRPSSEKLVCTLEDKDNYVLHYRNLKLYLQLGLQIKEIHSVLEFKQEAWLKPYIDFNTRKRMEAKTEFEKTFYKILNCSVFGKLMECQRKHLDVTLTNSERKLTKLAARPSFKDCRIFNENLVGVHCKRIKVLISKP